MAKNERYSYNPDHIIPPGETLKEAMDYLGIGIKDISRRTGITEQSIIRILAGKQPITYSTAQKLEPVTGISCEFWNNLESRYQERLQKKSILEKRKQLEEFLKKFPLTELITRGYINSTQSLVEQAIELFKFFRVSSIDAFYSVWKQPSNLARSSKCFATNTEIAATWIRIGEIEAEKIVTKPFNRTKFKQTLKEIRTLTYHLPENFISLLLEMFAECGVALVLIPALNKVPWNGASKWIREDKVMIILNSRGKSEDKFWFSLFHETAHILKHGKREICIANKENNDPKEKEADNFAAEYLIPAKYNGAIINIQSETEILTLADELSISPAIIVSRYQQLTKKRKHYNYLIKNFDLV